MCCCPCQRGAFCGESCVLCVSAVGSPSLPDKYRHNREMLMLLPPHRDRPSSAMYSNITDNGQVQTPRAQGMFSVSGHSVSGTL